MRPIEFAERNDTLEGFNDVQSMPVHRDGRQVISCWALSPEELMEIQQTGVVWLGVMGSAVPPLYVTGSYPFETVKN